MPERKTVGQLMEEMRLKAGAQNYHGHEYMDLERFAEDTRHMIIWRAAAGGSAGVWAIWLVWPTPTLITRTTPSGAMTICPFCRNPGRWW